jgi:type II secretory pathway pseudopilin PulG
LARTLRVHLIVEPPLRAGDLAEETEEMNQRETGQQSSRRPQESGVSLAELLVVIALAGMASLAAVANWPGYKYRADVGSAAKMTEAAIHQARMYSVYRGVRHFVVLDLEESTVSIHVDSNGNAVFDGEGTDIKVTRARWPSLVALSLPPSSETLPDPTFPTVRDVTTGWDLPTPDSDGVWGSTKFGIMTTPTGQLMSTEATPQVISTGTVIFSGNMEGLASSVSLRGGGLMKSFWYVGETWRNL